MPNEKTFVLTVYEIGMLINILNSKSSNGYTIKDIRIIDKTINLLKKSLPPQPVVPKAPRKLEEGEKYTPEEEKEYQKSIDEYSKNMGEFFEKEVEIALGIDSILLITQKLRAFSGFSSDEYTRTKVISLANKFGI